MVRSLITALLVVSCFGSSLLGQRSEIRLLFVGDFHRGTVGDTPRAGWIGLFPTQDGFELRAVQIRRERIHDSCLDEAPEHKSGERITVTDSVRPIFLLHGLEVSISRRVKTIFWGDLFVPPNQSSVLTPSDSERYVFEAHGKLGVLNVGPTPTDYRLTLTRTKLKISTKYSSRHLTQELCSFPRIDTGNPPSVVWVGDLDGDGALDFLFENANHYAAQRFELLLSSRATSKEVAGVVADFSQTGC